MAWIGLRTRYEAAFNTAGLGRAQLPAPVTDDSLLTRGSLMAEVIVSPVNRPTNLLRYAVLDPWPAAFTIVQEPNGTFRLLLRNGPRDLAASLHTDLRSSRRNVPFRSCTLVNAASHGSRTASRNNFGGRLPGDPITSAARPPRATTPS